METATQNIEVSLGADQRVTDERMMARALELAAQGIGQVSPSPLVGCVIADREGHIVGEGYYLYDRGTHAEALALEEAGDRARGGTAYVTLEPHAHHSRTPPCTEALINAGVARVVYAIDDPNPLISGRGGEGLGEAGVEVLKGVRAQDAARQNEVYLHFQQTGRPFVHLKMACSLDGTIGPRRGESHWLTGEESRVRVHELRHRYDAILVGANTVRIDDPLLTDRSGLPRRRPLVRVVTDHKLTTPSDAKLLNSPGDGLVLIYTAEGTGTGDPADSGDGIAVIPRGVRIHPLEVLRDLSRRGLQSVLIEGGPTIAAAFLAEQVVNKITFLIAPRIIGGLDSPRVIGGYETAPGVPTVRLENVESLRHGDDIEITGYPQF